MQPFETHQGAFRQSNAWIMIGHTLETLYIAFSSGFGVLLYLVVLVISVFWSGFSAYAQYYSYLQYYTVIASIALWSHI